MLSPGIAWFGSELALPLTLRLCTVKVRSGGIFAKNFRERFILSIWSRGSLRYRLNSSIFRFKIERRWLYALYYSLILALSCIRRKDQGKTADDESETDHLPYIALEKRRRDDIGHIGV